MRTSIVCFLLAALLPVLCLSAPIAASAQRPIRAAQFSQPAPQESQDTVAILPFVYVHGTPGAIRTANALLRSLVTRGQLEIVTAARVEQPWYRTLEGEDLDAQGGLADDRYLTELGTALGVDWVVTGRAEWRDARQFLDPEPISGSVCTVELRILDVRRHRFALVSSAVRVDSRATEREVRDLRAVLGGELPPAVTEDTRAPHQARAVTLALARAIQPWLEARLNTKQSSRKGLSGVTLRQRPGTTR
jgi:TolB-like protein